MTGKQAIKSYELVKKALYRVLDRIAAEDMKDSDSQVGRYTFNISSALESDVRGWIQDIQRDIDKIEEEAVR